MIAKNSLNRNQVIGLTCPNSFPRQLSVPEKQKEVMKSIESWQEDLRYWQLEWKLLQKVYRLNQAQKYRPVNSIFPMDISLEMARLSLRLQEFSNEFLSFPGAAAFSIERIHRFEEFCRRMEFIDIRYKTIKLRLLKSIAENYPVRLI